MVLDVLILKAPPIRTLTNRLSLKELDFSQCLALLSSEIQQHVIYNTLSFLAGEEPLLFLNTLETLLLFKHKLPLSPSILLSQGLTDTKVLCSFQQTKVNMSRLYLFILWKQTLTLNSLTK